MRAHLGALQFTFHGHAAPWIPDIPAAIAFVGIRVRQARVSSMRLFHILCILCQNGLKIWDTAPNVLP